MEYKIIKLEKKDFPDKLKNIQNVPKMIYLIGNVNLLYEDCFGIVGTRKITEYGIKNCEFFTKELVLRDIPIISGMAIGTDTVAHKTTLEFGGKTIAVLGSGFNNIFPQENIELFHKIIENNGLVITEFEENVKPLKENFPKRNRIVTALSEGILVIEAAYRSGTSITVQNAKNQGKKVFALPGKLDSCVGIGVNNMIKKGAILTTQIDDILKCYPQFEKKIRKDTVPLGFACGKIKNEYKEIYELIKKEDLYLQEILEVTNLDSKNLLKILTKMEIDGILQKDILGKYKIL